MQQDKQSNDVDLLQLLLLNMNWLPRKIIYATLAKFFKNISEKDIDVNILCSQHLRLKNLELKTEMIKSDTSPVILSQCRIGYLEMAFDPLRLSEEPLSITVSEVQVILKFNEKRKDGKPKEISNVLHEYYKQLKTPGRYKDNVLSMELEHLKVWLIELANRKINLFISKILVALEYNQNEPQSHYFGATIDQINVKSRTIVAVNREDRVEEKFVNLSGIGLFAGASKIVKQVNTFGNNREVWLLDKIIDKVYFMKDLEVSVTVIIEQKKLSVVIENFIMNITPYVLKEITNLVKYMKPFINFKRPKEHPGQGEKCNIPGLPNLREGTRKWWQYINNKVLELVGRTRKYNILLNPSFRKYVFCIFYHIAYDRQEEVMQYMRKYELGKNKREILEIHQFMMEKISEIRANEKKDPKDRKDETPNRVFIKLISNAQSSFKSKTIKKLTYADIKRSTSEINIENGAAFIHKLELQSFFQFTIKLHLKDLHIFLSEQNVISKFKQLAAQQLQFKIQFQKLDRQDDFAEYVQKMYYNFIDSTLKDLNFQNQVIIPADKWNTYFFRKQHKPCYGEISIENVYLDMCTGQKMALQVNKVEILDLSPLCYYPQFLLIKNVGVRMVEPTKSQRSFEQDVSGVDLQVEYVCVNMLKPFFEKVFFLVSLITFDLDSIKEDVTVYEPTMKEVIYKNLLKSTHFKNYVKTELHVKVSKVNILFPVDYSIKNDILVAQVIGAEVRVNGSGLLVETQSTKLLFTNSYNWCEEDNVFKRKIIEMQRPRQDKVQQSLVMSLSVMRISKKEQYNDEVVATLKKLGDRKTQFDTLAEIPDEFLDRLEFIIPLIIIRISLKQLFYIDYLGRLWEQTGFNPQKFFKRKQIIKRRPDHTALSRRQQNLMNLLIKRIRISINGVAFCMSTVKHLEATEDTQNQDLYELFVNNITIEIKGYCFANSLDVIVSDVFLKNITGHLPINRIVMLRFVEAMLLKSDLQKKKLQDRYREDSMVRMIDQSASAINLNISNQITEPKASIILASQRDPESLLEGIDFRDDQKNDLSEHLIIFNDSENNKALLSLSKKKEYLLKTHQQLNTTTVDVSTVNVLMEVEFFKNILQILQSTKDFGLRRRQNFFEFIQTKGYIPSIDRVYQTKELISNPTEEEKELLQEDNVIIDVQQVVISNVKVGVDRVNLMICHKDDIVYCLTAAGFKMNLNNHYLYDQMIINANQVILVDTHRNAGQWQEMLSLDYTKRKGAAFDLLLKMYKNKSIIRKNRCKKHMKITIARTTVTYVGKKIMELVNCIMFIIAKIKGVKKRFSIKKTRPTPPDPINRFLYWIDIPELNIRLPQNSLSKNYFDFKLERGVVFNEKELQYEDQEKEGEQSRLYGSREKEYVFQPCEKFGDQEIEFQSFVNDNNIKQIKIQKKTFVLINSLSIPQPNQKSLSRNPLFNIPHCQIEIDTMYNTQVYINFAEAVDLSFNEAQFQLLMRTCTQTFMEKPMVFDSVQLDLQKKINDRIDAEFYHQMHPDQPMPVVQEPKDYTAQPKLGTTVSMNMGECAFNMYGDDYNLSLVVNLFLFKFYSYTNDTKDFEIVLEQIQFYNNQTNKMFINSYSDEKDNQMGDRLYQPPPGQVFNKFKFTKDKRDAYLREMCRKYRFKPRLKEDLNIMEKTQTTYLQGWSEEVVPKQDKNYVKVFKCLRNLCCGCSWCYKKKQEVTMAERQRNQNRHAGESQSLLDSTRFNEAYEQNQDQSILANDQPENSTQINKSFITSSDEMLKRRYYEANTEKKMGPITDTFMKMIMHQCHSGEKNIEIRINNLNLAISEHKELLWLTNYMVKGIMEEQPNSKIRKHLRYNNFPPQFIGMKLNNCKAIIGKSLDEDCKSYLQSLQDVVMSVEKMGDVGQGPGISKMKVQCKAILHFCRYVNRKIVPIEMSSPINFVLAQDSKVPLIINSNVQHTASKEVLLFGQKKDVQIKVPLTYMKSIQAIVKPLFPESKPPEGTVGVVFPKQQTPQHVIKFLFGLILDNMKVLIPSIKIQLLRGQFKPLIQLQITDTFMDIISISTKSPKEHYGKMRIFTTLTARYMNLGMSKFEPVLQPFMLGVRLRETLHNNAVSKKLKIGSISGSSIYENTLNLNLSIALVRNLKEALTRYQGNYDNENDAVMDLTDRFWNKQLTLDDESQLLKTYRVRKEFYDTFFGKKFIKLQNSRNDTLNSNKYWNIGLRQYIVMHSFFDYTTGRKMVHFRTPYRVHNFTGKEIVLSFRDNRLKDGAWMEILRNGLSHAVPKDIFARDIIMLLSFERRGLPHIDGYSLLYLLCEYEERMGFKKGISPSLEHRVYRLSADIPPRYIRKSDFLLDCDGHIIIGVCIKSEYSIALQQQSSRSMQMVYETSVILLPPIIVKNELPMFMQFFVNQKSYNLPSQTEIYITDIPHEFTTINVSVRKFSTSDKVSIFTQKEKTKEYIINVSEFYQIALKCNKLSDSVREVIIYSTFIFRNLTYENFEIGYESRRAVLEKYFWFFITDTYEKSNDYKPWIGFHKTAKNHYLFSIIERRQVLKLQRISDQSQEDIAKKIIIDVPDAPRPFFESNERICNNSCCIGCEKCTDGCWQFTKGCMGCSRFTMKGCTKCLQRCGSKVGCEDCCYATFSKEGYCGDCNNGCFGPRGCCAQCWSKSHCPKRLQCSKCCQPRKVHTDPNIQVFQVVMKSLESKFNISKTLILSYRYEVVNQTSRNIVLFHHNVELFRLEPKIRRSLYYYKSDSDMFRIGLCNQEEGKLLYSSLFQISAVRQLTVKIPKQTHLLQGRKYPYQQNYLFNVRIAEASDLLFIKITDVDTNHFPIFFENSSTYDVRVIQGDQDYVIPAKQRIPFFFSNLDFNQGNVMILEIEGMRKVIKMNQMSDLESFGLDEFKFAQRSPIKSSYKKGKMGILFRSYYGDFNVVVDVLMQEFRIYDDDLRLLTVVSLKHSSFIDSEGNKIYIYLPGEDQLLLTVKDPNEYQSWKDVIGDTLSLRTPKRIFMTVDSDRYSRILKLQQTKGDKIQSIRKIQIEIFLKSLNVTMVNSEPMEIILLNMNNIRLIHIEDLKKSVGDNIMFVTYDDNVNVGFMKISNQTEETSNPVVAAQNRRGDFPFMELKASKRFSVDSTDLPADPTQIQVDDSFSTINHYSTITLYLDEIEIMVDSFLMMEIIDIKHEVTKTLEVYAKKEDKIAIAIPDINDIRRKVDQFQQDREIYINYLNIEPIKITMSVNWNFNPKEQFKGDALSFLRLLPFGIQHATIQLKSFSSYHVFQKSSVLLRRLLRFYTDGIILQILRNAGSYDLLAPLKILSGMGQGARYIFYEPIYTMYKQKQIKATMVKCLQGVLSLIVFLIAFMFRMFEIMLRLFAFFTFDREYTERRNSFHRQTIKSPWIGCQRGFKYFVGLFPEFVRGFSNKPKLYHKKYGCPGIIIGLVVAMLGVIKLVLGPLDWIWAFFSGLFNMAYYEEDAMQTRSRPIRVFTDGTIKCYNYSQALAYEVMRSSHIQPLKNQQVQFARIISFHNKRRYYIITNYRFIFCKENMSKTVVKFYKIKTVSIQNWNWLRIELTIPDTHSYFLFSTHTRRYWFEFQHSEDAELVRSNLIDALQRNVAGASQGEMILV